MSSSSSSGSASAAGVPRQALEQAAQWFALLQDENASAADHRRWADWLAAHANHQRAWQRVQAISRQFAMPRQLDAPARAAADQALHSAAHVLTQRRRAFKALAVLGLGCGTGWVASHAPAARQTLASLGWDWRSDHNTGTGENRELRLADGTRLWLAPQTAIDVADARGPGQAARLTLRQGEILVDTGRPQDASAASSELTVQTPLAQLRPLGTRFSVRAGPHGGQLSVFGGEVAIVPQQRPAAQRVVASGQQADFTGADVGPPRRADEARQSWAAGLLLADDMPLADWVAELARYRHGRLACDPAIAHLRVAGGFPLHDTDRALAMLAQALPVRVRYTLPWWVGVEPLPSGT